MQKGALFKRNKIKFSIDPRRSPEAEEKKYIAHFLHGLFTRPSVKNPPIGCNKLVYERFEPERRPWYVSTNPLSPLSHRAPIGINMFPDREGGSWRKTRGALHKVRTINLDFEALICLAVPRGKRWLGDWDRWTASQENFERRIQCQTIPSASGVPSGSAWLYLELSIIDWFETRRHYRFAIVIYTWRGGGLFLTNVRDDDAEICKIFH